MNALSLSSHSVRLCLGVSLLLSLAAGQSPAQETTESFAFNSYCWQCSRSFQSAFASNDRDQALQAAWDRRQGETQVVVIEARDNTATNHDAWSVNFAAEDRFPNVERFVFERVDGRWQQVATPASRRAANEFAAGLAQQDRPAVVLLRIGMMSESESK